MALTSTEATVPNPNRIAKRCQPFDGSWLASLVYCSWGLAAGYFWAKIFLELFCIPSSLQSNLFAVSLVGHSFAGYLGPRISPGTFREQFVKVPLYGLLVFLLTINYLVQKPCEILRDGFGAHNARKPGVTLTRE